MLIGDIAGELLGGMLKMIGNILLEVMLEILIRGPGYLICRTFKRDIDPDAGRVIVVGGIFWVFVVIGVYITYSYFSEALAIDRCLDSGEAFNHQTQQCIRS